MFFLGWKSQWSIVFFFLMISDHRSARSKNVYFQQDSYPSTLLYIFLLVFILYIYHVIYIISYLHVTSQMITLVVPFTQSFPQWQCFQPERLVYRLNLIIVETGSSRKSCGSHSRVSECIGKRGPIWGGGSCHLSSRCAWWCLLVMSSVLRLPFSTSMVGMVHAPLL